MKRRREVRWICSGVACCCEMVSLQALSNVNEDVPVSVRCMNPVGASGHLPDNSTIVVAALGRAGKGTRQ